MLLLLHNSPLYTGQILQRSAVRPDRLLLFSQELWHQTPQRLMRGTPEHFLSDTIFTGSLHRFQWNTRAIIGVAVACAVSIIVAVFVVFFACKRFKLRERLNAGVANLSSWHPPLVGDESQENLRQPMTINPLRPETRSSQVTELILPSRPEPYPVLGSCPGSTSSLHSSSITRSPLIGLSRTTAMVTEFDNNDYAFLEFSEPSDLNERQNRGSISSLRRIYADASHGADSYNADSTSQQFPASTSFTHNLRDKLHRPSDETTLLTQKEQPPSNREIIGRLHSQTLDTLIAGGSVGSFRPNPRLPSETKFYRGGRSTSLSTLPSHPFPITEGLPRHVGLLTPHLGMRRSSSKHSSSASLRDNVDYSRPIGGVCVSFFSIFTLSLISNCPACKK